MAAGDVSEGRRNGLSIDCSGCPNRGTSACEDCLVAYILDRPEGAIVFDAAEERALRALREGGLLPDVRFGRKTG
ncbi:MAG: hypothetical protein ACXVQY_11505 [Actinomycetota bacterium]